MNQHLATLPTEEALEWTLRALLDACAASEAGGRETLSVGFVRRLAEEALALKS